MNTNELVAALDTEIARLTQIRNLLGDLNGNSPAGAIQRTPAHFGDSSESKRRGRPKGSKNKATSFNPEEFATKRGTMSIAGKERVAAAQRARWAKLKGTDAANKSRPTMAEEAVTKSAKPRPATKKTILQSKKSTAKPPTKSAPPPKPAHVSKAARKLKLAKKVVAKSAVKTPTKKPSTLEGVKAQSQATSSSASTNAFAEEALTAAAE